MRKGLWALAIVAIVAVAVALIGGLQDEIHAPSTGPAVTHPAAAAPPQQAQPARHYRPFYQRHRDQVLRVSDYSRRARSNHVVAVICFLLFAFVTLPGNIRSGRAFFRQLVASAPLPDAAGADDGDNRRARRVLFFYLLFLLYQIVQFPLTWGRDNAVQFTADLFFQALLLAGVVLSYRSLKRAIALRLGPDRRETMKAWQSTRLEGVSLRWRDLSRLALTMFIGGFAPALLAKLPDWLDVLAAV